VRLQAARVKVSGSVERYSGSEMRGSFGRKTDSAPITIAVNQINAELVPLENNCTWV
jgi:hypothetical protein